MGVIPIGSIRNILIFPAFKGDCTYPAWSGTANLYRKEFPGAMGHWVTKLRDDIGRGPVYVNGGTQTLAHRPSLCVPGTVHANAMVDSLKEDRGVTVFL